MQNPMENWGGSPTTKTCLLNYHVTYIHNIFAALRWNSDITVLHVMKMKKDSSKT